MIPKGITPDMLQNVTFTEESINTQTPFNTLTYYEDNSGGVKGQSLIVEPIVIADTKEITYPPLGLNPDIKPIKTTGNIEGGSYPDCLKKWEEYLTFSKFSSQEAMESAKKQFMTDCLISTGKSESIITEPVLGLEINPSDGLIDGSNNDVNNNGNNGSVGVNQETSVAKDKKGFPYWLIAVVLAGGYFIFRKKE